MDFKIVSDSSLDMNNELEKSSSIELIPFKLYIDEKEIVDDKTLDLNNFISEMVKSKTLPRTACPSPSDFKEAYNVDKNVFAITISSKLSGTYNSAVLAKTMMEEDGKENIHVFDSKSASVGQTVLGLKIEELIKEGKSFESIIDIIEEKIRNMKTFFISESLNNLIKNGRIPTWKGKLAMALKIRPIMQAVGGEISVFEKARGSNKAFERLANIVKETAGDSTEKVLAISHVNNFERASSLKTRIEELCEFKEVIIVPTHGLSSLYCDDQGIIIAY